MSDPLDEAAERWKRGMRAAQPLIRQRQAAQRTVQVANRARGAEHRCSIKGCERHAFKATLCRKHWAMVPLRSKQELMMDCMIAQRKTAEKHYRRMARELKASLSIV